MKVFYCIEALLDKSAFRLKQFVFSSIGTKYVYNLMQRKQKLQQVLLLMHS